MTICCPSAGADFHLLICFQARHQHSRLNRDKITSTFWQLGSFMKFKEVFADKNIQYFKFYEVYFCLHQIGPNIGLLSYELRNSRAVSKSFIVITRKYIQLLGWTLHASMIKKLHQHVYIYIVDHSSTQNLNCCLIINHSHPFQVGFK